MEGLEIKEFLLSEIYNNKDFRIDTNFWTVNLKYNSKLKYKFIGECLKEAQYGISIQMNEENEGFPIYRMNEIHSMLCDFEVKKHALISRKEMNLFKLNNRDVLFNRTNSYEWVGRTGIFYKTDFSSDDFVFASYLVRFVPDEEIITPEYLTIFLNSKYGILDIKRRARQSINQTNVNPEEVKEIKIPILDKKIQTILTFLLNKIKDILLKARNYYHEAEKLLLQELDLENFVPDSNSINIKNFSESFLKSGRLDAEFYQPKYEDIENKIKNNRIMYTFINNEFLQNKKCIKKSLDNYNYIEIGDINVTNGYYSYNLIEKRELPANAKIKANQNDLLVSKVRPYRGAVSIINENISNLIVSNAFTVLKEKGNYKKEVLFILLRTNHYKQWLLKFNVGTSYPVIKDEDILNLPIPLFNGSIQEKVKELIQESFSLREKSKILLEVAKKAVEIAIEVDEQKALEYIKIQIPDIDM